MGCPVYNMYLHTLFRNIDYPRLCYYPCLLARCPANNAKEENVKLIEISFVSWFSSLLGQVQKAAEIINRSQTHSMVGSQTTDTRWQNPKFFAAQIQIPIPDKYLGFRYKDLVFFVEMENMDSTQMGAYKLAKIPQNLSAQLVCPSPKYWVF